MSDHMPDHVIDIDTQSIPKKVLLARSSLFTGISNFFAKNGKTVKHASSSADTHPVVVVERPSQETVKKKAPDDESSKEEETEAKTGVYVKNASSSADTNPPAPVKNASSSADTHPVVVVERPSQETVKKKASDDETHDEAPEHSSSHGPTKNETPMSSSKEQDVLLLILDEMVKLRTTITKANAKRGKAKKAKKPTQWWEPTTAGSNMKGLSAMVSIMLNTLLYTAGITPPKMAENWWFKKLYQVAEFAGTLCSSVSLLILLLVNPLSSRMHTRTLNIVNSLMGLAFLALLVVFSGATLLVSADGVAYSVCGFCLLLILVAILFFVSERVRTLLRKFGVDLTGTDENDAFKVRTKTQKFRNSDVPVSDVPDADVPVSDVPDADVPDSDVPDADVPDADVPDSDVPDSDVPDSDVPDSEVSMPDLISDSD